MSDDGYWKQLAVAANDNCDALSISRAEAMAHVKALIGAFQAELARSGKKPLAASVQTIQGAQAWVDDPIGILRPGTLPPGYEVNEDGPLTRWSTPDGFRSTTSTPAVGAIKCWQHWTAAQERKLGGNDGVSSYKGATLAGDLMPNLCDTSDVVHAVDAAKAAAGRYVTSRERGGVVNENLEQRLDRLERWLHSRCRHPDYEYSTTDGPRKSWDDQDRPPAGEGWERNVDYGDEGWERFDYHEESYWRRRTPSQEVEVS